MADPIANLPMASKVPSEQEIKIMNALFGTTSSWTSVIIPSIMFFILSLPIVDTFLAGFITAPPYAMLAIKTGLFLGIILLVQTIN